MYHAIFEWEATEYEKRGGLWRERGSLGREEGQREGMRRGEGRPEEKQLGKQKQLIPYDHSQIHP